MMKQQRVQPCHRLGRLDQGFTLVEALVTIAIVTVAMTAIVFSITQGMTGIRQNGELVQARAAATRQMELIRNLPFAQLLGLNGQPFLTPDGRTGLEALPNATGTIFVNPFNGPNLLRVTVRVTVEGRPWNLVSLFSP